MRKFLRWIILSEKEWNWQIDQAKEIGENNLKAENDKLKRKIGILQKNLGLAVKREEELKEEVERYKEIAEKQIEEKKALFKSTRRS
jgi:hypothetical protein